VLNLSDGNHSLLDIAERSGLPFNVICDAADFLSENGLLSPVAKEGDEKPARPIRVQTTS
jgi:hypothetical protein